MFEVQFRKNVTLKKALLTKKACISSVKVFTFQAKRQSWKTYSSRIVSPTNAMPFIELNISAAHRPRRNDAIHTIGVILKILNYT